MKNIIIITGIVLFSTLFSAKSFAQSSHSEHKENSSSCCSNNQKHKEASCPKDGDHSAHKQGNLTEHNHADHTKSALFVEYFKLKDAFVRSDFESVKSEAKAIEKTANNDKIKQLSKEIYSAKNIDTARVVLSEISEEYILLAKESKAGIYIAHCSMALNNKGANWLSLEKEIKNPYFGNKMLTCGNVVGKTNE
ncbi:DUF3347 domain-containing protein [Massilibacteroides vaginae]|uniref:DUF3347 domain-containing protein n=1 Tax=Massilibacteroides vaginae TaxID=1673718 RepID=UPI000A1CF01B|nr:DUF3347 domain-containing protein [Massilibacteroides vaginae]